MPRHQLARRRGTGRLHCTTHYLLNQFAGRAVFPLLARIEDIDSIAERVLVLRCQTGDRQALEELYLRHSRRLDYYLRRLLPDEAAVADVKQDVWLTVIRRIARLKHAEAFLVWLYRIARTRALDRLVDMHPAEPLTIESTDQLPDERAPCPGEGFSPADAAAIHQALATLSLLHREVLVLRFIENLSYEQIATVIGSGVGTVRSRLFYAKQALRTRLEKYHDAI